MHRLLFVAIAGLTPLSAYADACSWLDGWNVEMDAANASVSASTREFLEVENPAVNDMVDAPTKMLADWWIVDWLCAVPDIDRPKRGKDAVEQK